MTDSPSRVSIANTIFATVVLAVVVLGLTTVAGADAGTYAIDDCPAAQTGNYNVGPWTQSGSVPGPGSFKQTCARPGDSFGISSGELSSNGTAGEELQAPFSISIQRVRLWWEAPKPIDSGGWSYALIDAYSPEWSRIYQSETPVAADGSGEDAPTELLLPANTTKLQVEIYCTRSQNCDYVQNPLKLLGSQLTLADPNLPTATITGGALASPGPASGTESLAYGAQDTGSGVRAAELLLDGRSVAKNDYLAQCPYQNFAACPQSLSDAIDWNTAGVSNGAHELALRVVNAAGNASIVDEHTITVDNPLLAGIPTDALAHVANGQSPCAGAALSLAVNGRTAPPTVSYGKPITVTGRLHCGAVPIREARVQIATTASPPGTAIATSAQTNQDGSFSYTVPRGPDRKLRFSYTAYSDDPAPSATATATVSVRPRIALHIAPHLLSNDHTMRWTGTIGPGPYPRQGTTLLVEVRDGTHWKTFDQVVAGAKGRFAYTYTFRSTFEPTTYTFRVALPDTGAQGYPYAPTTSNTVNVHVEP
jgi:hypothetical protein